MEGKVDVKFILVAIAVFGMSLFLSKQWRESAIIVGVFAIAHAFLKD